MRVAKTLEEACKLLEVGFEYVCDMDDAKLFRKRSYRVIKNALKLSKNSLI